MRHVIKVNPNLRARIVPTVTQSESDLDLYALQYIDEVGSGYFEYRRIFGEWADHYGTFYKTLPAENNPVISAETEFHKRMVPDIKTLQFRCVLIESDQALV